MTYEQESQLQDFSKAISYTAKHNPNITMAEVIEHAWTMVKNIYFHLTLKDKKFFLKHIDLPSLAN